MIERINLIIQAKNITPSQFADEINIQRSGMSHIMSGRNKPSLDFVMRVLKRYPEIDTNWLLFGKGEMYSTSSTVKSEEQNEVETNTRPQSIDNQITMFDDNRQIDMFSSGTEEFLSQNTVLESVEPQVVEKTSETQIAENPQIDKNAQLAEISINDSRPDRDTEKTILEKERKKAVRYLVFYSDHTFEEFTRAEED